MLSAKHWSKSKKTQVTFSQKDKSEKPNCISIISIIVQLQKMLFVSNGKHKLKLINAKQDNSLRQTQSGTTL